MASIYGGASGNGWKLRLDYTVTQDRAANTSSLRLRTKDVLEKFVPATGHSFQTVHIAK